MARHKGCKAQYNLIREVGQGVGGLLQGVGGATHPPIGHRSTGLHTHLWDIDPPTGQKSSLPPMVGVALLGIVE